MKLPLIAVLSWAIGLFAYVTSCWLFYQQTVSRGDFLAVASRSFLAWHTAFLLIFIPCFYGLAGLRSQLPRRWLFALVGAALCFVPTFFIFGAPFDLQARYVFSHEARLFYCFFAVSGALAGLAFTYVSKQRNV
jgi:uncharacterized membrane protein YjjP (DUF1212 family)